jgi:hypothetical protein
MNPSRTLPLILLTAILLAVRHAQAAPQSDEDAIKLARSVLKADRQAVVTDVLQLSETESPAFWPLYHQYRAEMDKVADGLVKLVQEYSDLYPNVPDDRAKQMLKNLTDLENKRQATRASYLKKFGKVLPAAKNLRFAQVENRLDLAVQLKMASVIPLVPIEGRMTPGSSAAVALSEGVPGGVAVQTADLTARVAAIDKVTRGITLVSSDGIKKTIKAGPEVVNFDQIRVGDLLKVRVTQELVVQMAKPGEALDDGAAAAVVLAPVGAKPGGVAAQTTRVTATVTAIDLANRTATLRFEDGSTRTVAVRPDVDLSQRKVGEKVMFRLTEMVALSVQKP